MQTEQRDTNRHSALWNNRIRFHYNNQQQHIATLGAHIVVVPLIASIGVLSSWCVVLTLFLGSSRPPVKMAHPLSLVCLVVVSSVLLLLGPSLATASSKKGKWWRTKATTSLHNIHSLLPKHRQQLSLPFFMSNSGTVYLPVGADRQDSPAFLPFGKTLSFCKFIFSKVILMRIINSAFLL